MGSRHGAYRRVGEWGDSTEESSFPTRCCRTDRASAPSSSPPINVAPAPRRHSAGAQVCAGAGG
ncbi:hypothetical protein BN2497_6775 [Janthinobacterium sp. CG23_2]|nr:hypothetical protein BN2497_6775 [Janthinobacterium sp. CG23_2]CUU29785.1 hypothetical protein BN3177_6775 [Janthinobacterium sp. CG23_2]